jgi:hypothetical protein
MTEKEASAVSKSVVVVEKAVSVSSTTPSSTWKGWLWDSADVSKEERKFLLKVGWPLTFNPTLKYLDRLTLIIVGLHPFNIRNTRNVN